MTKHSTRQFLGKIGFGSACAVCCVAPMLVLAGVVTGASLAVGGAVLAAITGVVVTTVLVATGRAAGISSKVRLPLVGVGGAGAFVGLWGISTERAGATTILALAVAVLTVAALLVLADAGVGADRTQT